MGIRYASLIEKISRPKIVLISFVIFMLVGFAFYPLSKALGGTLLDSIKTTQGALDFIAGLNAAQIKTHLFASGVVDVLYPLAYFAFLAGMTAWAAPKWKIALTIPAAATAIIDLCENTMHVIALTGNTGVLAAKPVLTNAKFSLFILAAVIMIICIIWGLITHFRGKKTPDYFS